MPKMKSEETTTPVTAEETKVEQAANEAEVTETVQEEIAETETATEMETETVTETAEVSEEDIEITEDEEVEEINADESDIEMSVADEELLTQLEEGLADSLVEEEYAEDELEEVPEEIANDIDEALGNETGSFTNDLIDVNTSDDEDKEKQHYDEKGNVITKESVFIQSAKDDEEMTSNQIWGQLKDVLNVGVVIPASVIGTEIVNISNNNVLCVQVKFLGRYGCFDCFIPFEEFFSSKEIALYGLGSYTSLARYTMLKQYLGGVINVRLVKMIVKKDKKTGEILNRYVLASRKRALSYSESKYFVTGIKRRNSSKKVKVKEGDIIRGCRVLRVATNYIISDICGVPTKIDLPYLSWEFHRFASEIFKVGDSFDVKILEINDKRINNGSYRDLVCSVKALKPNHTKTALMRAVKQLGKRGETIGHVTAIRGLHNNKSIGYYIRTEKGYNAIAVCQSNQLNPTANGDIAKTGSRVIFHPLRTDKKETLMVGIISKVL